MHLIRLEASPLPGMIHILISVNTLISASISPQILISASIPPQIDYEVVRWHEHC